jgi:hypothetical protein
VRQEKEMDAIGHGGKAGTPTMGGVLIIFTTLVSAVLWCQSSNPQVWIVLATMLFMGGDRLRGRLAEAAGAEFRGPEGMAEAGAARAWVVIAFAAIEAVPERRPTRAS